MATASNKKTALEKRIKRQLTARQQTFFAAVTPGLETVCRNELSKLPLLPENISVVDGGVEFKGYVHDCYQANLHLRTASRILMRIGLFQATNFRQLDKKLSDIPWELYLPSGALPEVRARTRHCRLHHTEAISQRIQGNITGRFATVAGLPQKKSPGIPQQIFIRGENDYFSLSIDSSGELLYKRGTKTQHGRAPIRETLAAATLLLAGYDTEKPLIDPMCGTGTFSLEAAMMIRNIPAGWFRDFAFMEWPCFCPERWNHIRREAEKLFRDVNGPRIFTSDRDSQTMEGVRRSLKKLNASELVQATCRDFFTLSASDISLLQGEDCSSKSRPHPTGLIVINPPYGLRIGTRKESRKLFARMLNHLCKYFKGWNLALIVPEKHLKTMIPFTMKTVAFSHGGTRREIGVGKID